LCNLFIDAIDPIHTIEINILKLYSTALNPENVVRMSMVSCFVCCLIKEQTIENWDSFVVTCYTMWNSMLFSVFLNRLFQKILNLKIKVSCT